MYINCTCIPNYSKGRTRRSVTLARGWQLNLSTLLPGQLHVQPIILVAVKIYLLPIYILLAVKYSTQAGVDYPSYGQGYNRSGGLYS